MTAKEIGNILLVIVCLSSGAQAQQFDYTPGFEPGRPVEMAALPMEAGRYDVALFFPSRSEAGDPVWSPWATVEAHFESLYDGTFYIERNEGFPIQATNPTAGGAERWAYIATWSYDRFNGTFRTVFHDNILALADIYEGGGAHGALSLSNLNTSTFNNHGSDGGGQKNRINVTALEAGAFEIVWFTLDESQARGTEVDAQNWQRSVRMVYTPTED